MVQKVMERSFSPEKAMSRDRSEVTSSDTGATVRAVTPILRARLMTAAPTPVAMKHSAVP